MSINRPILSFDIETAGEVPLYALQPWRVRQKKAWISTVAMTDGSEEGEEAHVYPTKDFLRFVLKQAQEDNAYILGWNVAFDAAWLCAYGLEDEVFKTDWLDGLLLWKHLDNELSTTHSFGLKAPDGAIATFAPELLGYDAGVEYNTVDPAKLQALLEYNIMDVKSTLQVTKDILARLTPEQLKVALIEAQSIPLVARANAFGMHVDMDAVGHVHDLMEKQVYDAATELREEGVTEDVIRSPAKLRKLLFQEWGLPIVGITASKQPSTDKESLNKLAKLDKRADKLRLWREGLNLDKKFANALDDSVAYNGDGKTYPQTRIFSTYCVPGETEVLTRNGWVRLDEWQSGDIMQATPDGALQFLPGEVFKGPVTKEWLYLGHSRFGCMVTPGHTVPFYDINGNWQITKAGDMGAVYKQYEIPRGGKYLQGAGWTPDQMRLFVAIQADGYDTNTHIKWTLQKGRKIERLCSLLDTLSIPYHQYVCDKYPDRTEITINRKQRPFWTYGKKVFGPYLLNAPYESIIAFVEELEFWDGTPHQDGGTRYISFLSGNVEWVLTCAALVGRKAALHADGRTVHLGVSRCTSGIRPEHIHGVLQDQQAFCAKTQTGYWLARYRGSIFITGNTGRFTISSKQGRGVREAQTGFAQHQMKNDKAFRKQIVAPPGYKLGELDAAGQEYRWMAVASEDENMLAMCAPGEDPHSFMGASIDQVPEHTYPWVKANKEGEAKQIRKMGKLGNLSLQYRTSAGRLQAVAGLPPYLINLDDYEAQRIHGLYPETYPGVPLYWERQIVRAQHDGYIRNLAGRVVKLNIPYTRASSWQLEQTAINYPIQGTGVEQKLLFLACVKDYMQAERIYWAWDLHDGEYFYLPEGKAEKHLRQMKKIADALPYKQAWGLDVPIPMPWDAKIGTSWGDLTEI